LGGRSPDPGENVMSILIWIPVLFIVLVIVEIIGAYLSDPDNTGVQVPNSEKPVIPNPEDIITQLTLVMI
jgi:hypothetical protein